MAAPGIGGIEVAKEAEKKRTTLVHVRLEPGVKKALELVAKGRGVSQQKIIADAIRFVIRNSTAAIQAGKEIEEAESRIRKENL